MAELVLRGRLVQLRPVAPADHALLDAILREPSVARWWTPPDAAGPAADWLADGTGATFVIEHEGAVVGSIQYSEDDDDNYRTAGIDLFLTSSAQGQGLGPDAIRTLARHLIDERGHHHLTIDPAATNANAIRAYQKIGFRRVGILRAYERGADGSWHDNLLLDLLANELT
jgi:aminoglycoside 6'-N-acetyltransferase